MAAPFPSHAARTVSGSLPLDSQANPRSTAILAVAKANNLDIETVEVDTANPPAEYLKFNKLSKVPTFVGEDGYVLYECIAIAIYGRFGHNTETPCPAPDCCLNRSLNPVMMT